ncbi:MAG: thiamine-phosphate kinase [Novosphingobium sp.]|nr:thiamine-phosphate kinase [Novosphingobium sp.]MCP5388899.1 thiamine-phosphate kinase [Novosphingobium sp.]
MANELKFIDALRALATHPAARGLDDDAAVLEIGGETLILTHDMMAQGTHFPANADMADLAWKLVAVNLSDLAAKGAEPLSILLGYALGEDDAGFVAGLRDVLEAFNVPLLGGDTIRAKGARCFGVTAIGRATHVPVPDRRNARPGEAVWVTGALGRAMLGFEGQTEFAGAFARPVPRLAEGRALAPHVGAMMDVSDGLLLDCWRMATASDVTIELERARLPVADPARLDECIRWGDDYELLFTLPEGFHPPVAANAIGMVAQKNGAALRLDGTTLTPADGIGYRH